MWVGLRFLFMLIFKVLLPVLLAASFGVQPVRSLPEPVSFEMTVAALDAHFAQYGEYPKVAGLNSTERWDGLVATLAHEGFALSGAEGFADTYQYRVAPFDYKPLVDEDGQVKGFNLKAGSNGITVRH